MMKKIFTGGFIALALALSMVLVGCGSSNTPSESTEETTQEETNNNRTGIDPSIIGTWKLSNLKVGETEFSGEELQQYLDDAGLEPFTLIFAADGTVEFNSFGIETTNLTYSYYGGEGTLSDLSSPLDFRVDNGGLSLEIEGTTLVLAKEIG